MEPSPPLFHIANHRRKIKSAVFGFGRGYSASDWIRFAGSVIATGFDGDIVLGVADMLNSTSKDGGVDEEDASKLLYGFLEYTSRHHHHVVVYNPQLTGIPKMVNGTLQPGMKCQTRDLYRDPRNGRTVEPDPRIPSTAYFATSIRVLLLCLVKTVR